MHILCANASLDRFEVVAVQHPLPSQQQQDRADVYALLAALLLGPDAALIEALAALPAGDAEDDDVALAWTALLQSAARGSRAVLAEYDALFVPAGAPRLNPCRCSYPAGRTGDRPPPALREDLRALGLVRAPGVTLLEDHLGALCETMRVLIERGTPLAVQQAFFERHVAGWAPRCLRDMAATAGADFYRALAAFAQAFFEREAGQAALAS